MGPGSIQRIRQAVPAPLVPMLVKRRLDKLWTIPEYREACEAQMRYLLEHTERSREIPELARAYAEQTMLRSFLRWHPRAITRQEVRGLEWLTTERDPDRAVIVSFMHHANYAGMFLSLQRAGGPHVHFVLTPKIMGPETEAEMAQHRKVMTGGTTVVPASGGTEALAALLTPGTTLAIASDVPGQTPVTFLGRRVVGSFGAARMAAMTDTPVVLATSWLGDHGTYIQIDPPLEPSAFAEPRDLLDAMLRRHGEAVLAFPEAFEVPDARFGALEE